MAIGKPVFLYHAVAWAAALSVCGVIAASQVYADSGPSAEPRCPTSGSVIVSAYDETVLEKKNVKVFLEDHEGLDSSIRQLYPNIKVQQFKVPETEMTAALERGVFDAAAYSCDHLLSDPEAFFNLFQGLQVWVLTEDAKGGPHMEPTEVSDYLP